MLKYINYIIESFKNGPMTIKCIYFNPKVMDLFLSDLDKYVDIGHIRPEMYNDIELKEDINVSGIYIELNLKESQPNYEKI